MASRLNINILGTNHPTEMVHLSKFAGFHEENCQETFKGPSQKIKLLIKVPLKK